jgi:hypothetical protein
MLFVVSVSTVLSAYDTTSAAVDSLKDFTGGGLVQVLETTQMKLYRAWWVRFVARKPEPRKQGSRVARAARHTGPV